MKKHVFEIKGLRKTLRVSWTAKKNDWVFSKAKVKRELLDIVKARKPAYDGHTMRNLGSCLAKEIMQGTMQGARRRGRPRTAWMDNIMTWTGLPVEESVRMSVCVCVCVCVFVCPRSCLRISTRPIFVIFLRLLPMAVAGSFSGGVVIHYVLPVLWMTQYLLISQGCSTSPPNCSAMHTQPWAWL